MSKFKKIFEPIMLKNVELKNRLVVSAMVMNNILLIMKKKLKAVGV